MMKQIKPTIKHFVIHSYCGAVAGGIGGFGLGAYVVLTDIFRYEFEVGLDVISYLISLFRVGLLGMTIGLIVGAAVGLLFGLVTLLAPTVRPNRIRLMARIIGLAWGLFFVIIFSDGLPMLLVGLPVIVPFYLGAEIGWRLWQRKFNPPEKSPPAPVKFLASSIS